MNTMRRRPQEPSVPYPYLVEEVRLATDTGVTLAGTLTRPSAGHAVAVLLIPGSGALDRDECVSGHRPFLVMADFLTREGVAVLRLDDRGVGGSTGHKDDCSHEDLVADVHAAMAFLSGRGAVDGGRVGLIGHSEGAIIAAASAARCIDIAFVILLAYGVGTGEAIIHEQAALISRSEGATEEQVGHERRMNEAVFEVLRSDLTNDAARAAIRPILRRFLGSWPGWTLAPADIEAHASQMAARVVSRAFRSFLTSDSSDYLRQLRCPVLALYGARDLQVPSAVHRPRLEAILANAGHAALVSQELVGLNHLFQTAETGALDEYEVIDETIAPVVLERLAAWIHLQGGNRPRATSVT